jgi:uncharacterized protein YabE (DUF348 family)
MPSQPLRPIQPRDTKSTPFSNLEMGEISYHISPTDTQKKLLYRTGFLLVGVSLLCAVTCAVIFLLPVLAPSTTRPVTMILGDVASQHQTRAGTVADLLNELAITLGDGDTVSPLPETAITSGMTVWVARARDISLTLDGEVTVIRTLFTNPVDILNEAGITLSEKDRVWVDGTETHLADMLVWPVPATRIMVRHARTVVVLDDGRQTEIETASDTVAEALYEGGFILYLADTVSPDLNTAITPDLTISIYRSSPISIIADGVSLETRAQGTTVADALGAVGVMLMGLDYSIPDENSPMQPGMIIRVIRVTEQVEAQQSIIPFEIVYQADSALELDQQLVSQEGQNGIQQTNVRIRFENGVEVSRETESTAVAAEPVNRVISYGTNIVVRTLETPDGPVQYWRRIRMYATSYHPAALGGDDVTATGRKLTKGVVGIDPIVIPYGSQVYVAGYGVGIAADTGGPRSTRLWIDLGYDDENWISWSKPVDVYLLVPVPPDIDYILPG